MNLDNIRQEVLDWQHSVFPKLPPLSLCKHLRKEIEEIEKELVEGENVKYEIADLFILLFELSDVLNLEPSLIIEEKLNILKKRNWENPDEFGVVEHKR